MNTSHPTRVAATLAAALVSLAMLTVSPPAVADAGWRVGSEPSKGGFGVADSDDKPRRQPHHDVRRWSPDGVDSPLSTGSRQDYTSWPTNPTATPGPDPMGYQHELYPPDTPRRDGSDVARTPSFESSPSTESGAPDYAQLALGGLAGVMIAAAAGPLYARRRRRSPLEAALATSDPDDIPRAAGLLGDLFVQQSHADAAQHAYRAAIDAGHPYWSPVAQVALAKLLTDRGDREEAQTLLEAAIASGHPRTTPKAQAGLDKLLTGEGHNPAMVRSPGAYETLDTLT
jgi:hypothetical protein